MHETPAWTAPYRLAVALRLLRARKINLISIVGVMLGVGSIIVVMSVMDGFQTDLREMIRGTLSDVIVEFDGKPVTDLYSYSEALYAKQPGDVVKIVVLRAGARQEVSVTLGRRGQRSS